MFGALQYVLRVLLSRGSSECLRLLFPGATAKALATLGRRLKPHWAARKLGKLASNIYS